MRTVIVYASVHHGNTEKLVKRIAEECQVDLIDAVKQLDADMSDYDMIGFASGIYFSKFHQSIICRKEVITKEQFIDLIQDATVQILF